VLVALGVFAAGYPAIARGIALGALFSVINFAIMANVLPRQISPSRRRSSLIALGSIVFRLAILAIPLIVAMKYASFHWVGAAIGLFAVPASLPVQQYISNRLSSKVA
jgi:hypothetical protein